MALRPSLKRERAAWADERLLIGVDEAGRGPLAGPVVAAAVVFPARCTAVRGLRDSKILPAKVRLRLALQIRQRALGFAIGAASSREIDRLQHQGRHGAGDAPCDLPPREPGSARWAVARTAS